MPAVKANSTGLWTITRKSHPHLMGVMDAYRGAAGMVNPTSKPYLRWITHGYHKEVDHLEEYITGYSPVTHTEIAQHVIEHGSGESVSRNMLWFFLDAYRHKWTPPWAS